MQQELDYEVAKSLSGNIQKESNAIKDILDRSDSTVKKVATNWKGVSADYALDQWNTWKKDFEEYYQMLLQNVKNIEKACNDYLAAETTMQQNYE